MTDLTPAAPLQTPAQAAHRRAQWMEEARALIRLAAPLILTQLAQMAILTTDIVMLGRLGKTALASAAIGNTVYYFAWLVGAGPAAAVSPMIAHISGGGRFDRAKVRAAVRMGLWAVGMLSVPLIGLMWLARPVLVALHQDPQLALGAGQFVSMLSFGLFFALGYQVLRNFSTSLGHPRAALWVMGASIAYNALADYALIFGHFGAPRLEIIGSGLATSSSSIFAFVAMLVVIARSPALRGYRIFRRFTRPVRDKLAEVFRLGLPIGMTMIFEAMLFNTMTLVMGTFGAVSVAAHQIALNFASITFMVPLGIAMAATVRVGLAAGRGDLRAARRAGHVALSVAAGFMALCGVAMILAGPQIASLYFGSKTADDQDVIAMASTFLKVAAAFQVFDALQVVGALSLRGLKDARAPMLLAGGSYWLVGAPICLILGLGLHMQGLGIWIGLAAGLGAAAIAMLLRFRWLTQAA
ncbi:MAG: MATE family efflux transporter [Caulobacteraceae bacterium]|nr:MATE family efflux transporter [Caulobacteraceae bacterium]